jgi:hypothetical protein
MADIDIIFKGALNSGTEETQLQVFHNMANRITISINDEHIDNYGYPVVIQLSKETAIKFHRELKKQISFIESEVSNE